MCEELCEKHETEMIALQKSLEMDLEKVRAELGLLSVENVQYKSKYHGLGGSVLLNSGIAKGFYNVCKSKSKMYLCNLI